MKLFITILMAFNFLIAADFDSNIKDLFLKKAGLKITSIKSIDLDQNLKFLIITDDKYSKFPVFATADGKNIIAYSGNFLSANDEVYAKIKTELDTLAMQNQKQAEKEAQGLYSKIPQEGILKLESGKSKTVVIVSDPECPYCRKELENLENKLKEANVYMIFAPVHGKSAFVKSDLIYQKAAKAKSNADKIKIIKEYFNPNVKLSESEMAMQPVITEKNAKIIFDSGIVKGVPFIFDLKK